MIVFFKEIEIDGKVYAVTIYDGPHGPISPTSPGDQVIFNGNIKANVNLSIVEKAAGYTLSIPIPSNVKLLVIIKKAHDLKAFDQAVDKYLDRFDKLIYYWYPIHQTNRLMRRAFLEEYKEYTHLAILCDDLVVNGDSINRLLRHIEEKDYSFICGVANYDNTEKKDFLNVSMQPTGNRRPYIFRSMLVDSEEHKRVVSQQQPVPIRFMGEPFPIIRRDVAEQLSFMLDDKIMGLQPYEGMNNDVVMSNEMYDLGIPIWCDFTAFFHHLKISDNGPNIPLVVGTKDPFTQFVPATV
jgi:hypothetical protein